jgi:hypothetical protein
MVRGYTYIVATVHWNTQIKRCSHSSNANWSYLEYIYRGSRFQLSLEFFPPKFKLDLTNCNQIR